MKKNDITYEEFIKKEAEKRGKELKVYVIDGDTHYSIGRPNIKRMAKTALELVK